MSTYRELVYMVADLVKSLSDDTSINESHIAYLLGRYRTYLLKQKYEKEARRNIPNANYQTICADLIKVPMMAGCSDGCLASAEHEVYLRTTKKIPELMQLGLVKVAGDNRFRDVFTFVSPERMEFVGFNKWLRNIVYCTVAPDDYMYFKSSNEAFLELKRVHITAIFEDMKEASDMKCCTNEDSGSCTVEACDEFDRVFPIEDALITQLLALVVRDVLGAAYRPKDDRNNANDDLADLASFIRSSLKRDVTDDSV